MKSMRGLFLDAIALYDNSFKKTKVLKVRSVFEEILCARLMTETLIKSM